MDGQRISPPGFQRSSGQSKEEIFITCLMDQSCLTEITSKNAGGNNSSMEPISLENLFRILPTGLVSKNLQGALRILLNMESWSLTEDFMQMEKKCMVLIMEDTMRHSTMVA